MKTTKKNRLFLLRWHKRMGLSSIVVLLMLCITGVLLNHTSHLNLGSKPIKATWLLNLYGVQVPQFEGVLVDGTWVSLVGQTLYRQQQKLNHCEGALVGATHIPNSPLWLAACAHQILLFTPDNELIETIGEAQGLKGPLNTIGLCGQQVCFETARGLFSANFDTLEWQLAKQLPYAAVALETLPKKWQQFFRTVLVGEDITWQRIAQDIHAARFFGKGGPWILDFFVLLFVFISFSGFYLWYKSLKRSPRH